MFSFNKLGVVIFLIQEYIYIYIKTIAPTTFSYLLEPLVFYVYVKFLFKNVCHYNSTQVGLQGFHKHNLNVDGLACGGGGVKHVLLSLFSKGIMVHLNIFICLTSWRNFKLIFQLHYNKQINLIPSSTPFQHLSFVRSLWLSTSSYNFLCERICYHLCFTILA